MAKRSNIVDGDDLSDVSAADENVVQGVATVVGNRGSLSGMRSRDLCDVVVLLL